MPSLPKIGIIAEDISDVESIKEIISRLRKQKCEFEKFTGKGCGKIKKKCQGWASALKLKGCKYLVLVHDLDRNNYQVLYDSINGALSPCPIDNYLISIPVEELEAWLLADLDCIQKYFSIQTKLHIKGMPESVYSPKEKIEELVYIRSKKKQQYLNAEHNPKIFKKINLTLINNKCPSFSKLKSFISEI